MECVYTHCALVKSAFEVLTAAAFAVSPCLEFVPSQVKLETVDLMICSMDIATHVLTMLAGS